MSRTEPAGRWRIAAYVLAPVAAPASRPARAGLDRLPTPATCPPAPATRLSTTATCAPTATTATCSCCSPPPPTLLTHDRINAHPAPDDPIEVIELVELLAFLSCWLRTDHDRLEASLRRYVGTDHYPISALRADLARLIGLLGGDPDDELVRAAMQPIDPPR